MLLLIPSTCERSSFMDLTREIGRNFFLFGLREDEKMGDTFRGAAISPTNQRTDYMIMAVSIGIVFALAVGGFVMAANSYGDQNQSPIDDPQKIVLDNFDPAEIAQPQTLRELDFVLESESGCWGPLCTEQGSIEVVDYNIPEFLPLCITNEFLRGWYVDVLVYGGYSPWAEGGYIDVWQKGDFQGRINIVWTQTEEGPCAYDSWRATFYVVEEFGLESNQYPDVAPWEINYPADQQTIPGKCVYLEFMTYWTGCVPGEEPSQDFTIIQSQLFYSFSKCFILTLQTHIQTIQPNHTS
jgi:hypothetical protein